jgi:hypothetical protein
LKRSTRYRIAIRQVKNRVLPTPTDLKRNRRTPMTPAQRSLSTSWRGLTRPMALAFMPLVRLLPIAA